MAFAKGHKKVGGIQKGQKQQRTMFREQLEDTGLNIIHELAGIYEAVKQGNDYHAMLDFIKAIMPYCYKKQPTDHYVEQQNVMPDYRQILIMNGIKPREE